MSKLQHCYKTSSQQRMTSQWRAIWIVIEVKMATVVAHLFLLDLLPCLTWRHDPDKSCANLHSPHAHVGTFETSWTFSLKFDLCYVTHVCTKTKITRTALPDWRDDRGKRPRKTRAWLNWRQLCVHRKMRIWVVTSLFTHPTLSAMALRTLDTVVHFA